MEEKLIARLESAVSRLETLSVGFRAGGGGGAAEGGGDAATDPSIVAFDDLMGQYFGRVSGAAEKIGGRVVDVTKVLEEAFNVQKELLIKVKRSQVLILAFGSSFVRYWDFVDSAVGLWALRF